TVNNLSIDNCTTYTTLIFNYTIVDEENQTKLTGTDLELSINISDNTINDNAWHHFVGVADRDGDATLYIDGEIQSDSGDISSVEDIDAPNNLRIGKHPDEDIQYFNGSITNVSIYNRALSEAEVLTLYTDHEIPAADQWGSGTELITNGEDWTNAGVPGATDEPDGWTIGAQGNYAIIAGALEIERNANNSWLRQEIAVTIGSKYRYSFEGKNIDATGYISTLGTSMGDNNIWDGGGVQVQATAFVRQEIEFTATVSTVHVTIQAATTGAGESVLFDNVRMTKIGS
ncbi:unnamed protein product, partial [marine sediment metagenome]